MTDVFLMPISGFRKRNSTCLYWYFSISGTFKISFILTKVEASNLVVFVNAFLKMNTENMQKHEMVGKRNNKKSGTMDFIEFLRPLRINVGGVRYGYLKGSVK